MHCHSPLVNPNFKKTQKLMSAAPCFRDDAGIRLASNPGILRPTEHFRQLHMRITYISYKIRIEIVTELLIFIFLIMETKDGQFRKIMVTMFPHAYAT
jgi:hypothetical protein